jgi:hypothetical protein
MHLNLNKVLQMVCGILTSVTHKLAKNLRATDQANSKGVHMGNQKVAHVVRVFKLLIFQPAGRPEYIPFAHLTGAAKLCPGF